MSREHHGLSRYACLTFVCCGCALHTVQTVSVSPDQPPGAARIVVSRGSGFTGSGCSFWVADDGHVLEADGSKAPRQTYAYAHGKSLELVDEGWYTYDYTYTGLPPTDLGSALAALALREKKALLLVPTPGPDLIGFLTSASDAGARERLVLPPAALSALGSTRLVDMDSGSRFPSLDHFFGFVFEGTEIGSLGMGGELVWDRAPGPLTLAVVSEPPFGHVVPCRSETIWTAAGGTYRFKVSPNVWNPEKTIVLE